MNDLYFDLNPEYNPISNPIVGICSACNTPLKESEPKLDFKALLLCSKCYISLVPFIYENSGYGDGGIIHYIFASLLTTNWNRKKRVSLKRNLPLFKKLLHKYRFSCVLCGQKDESKLTIDHIKPVSKGGKDSYGNLQILCRSCNSKKGAKYDK